MAVVLATAGENGIVVCARDVDRLYSFHPHRCVHMFTIAAPTEEEKQEDQTVVERRFMS